MLRPATPSASLVRRSSPCACAALHSADCRSARLPPAPHPAAPLPPPPPPPPAPLMAAAAAAVAAVCLLGPPLALPPPQFATTDRHSRPLALCVLNAAPPAPACPAPPFPIELATTDPSFLNARYGHARTNEPVPCPSVIYDLGFGQVSNGRFMYKHAGVGAPRCTSTARSRPM